jgi:hypothetical protein
MKIHSEIKKLFLTLEAIVEKLKGEFREQDGLFGPAR